MPGLSLGTVLVKFEVHIPLTVLEQRHEGSFAHRHRHTHTQVKRYIRQ